MFTDLTPLNEKTWAQAMTAYLPYMNETQKKKLFEELGYPVAYGEELPTSQPAAAPVQILSRLPQVISLAQQKPLKTLICRSDPHL
jgi:hypothetical protein